MAKLLDIHLGDALTAFALLKPQDAETRRVMLACLGLEEIPAGTVAGAQNLAGFSPSPAGRNRVAPQPLEPDSPAPTPEAVLEAAPADGQAAPPVGDAGFASGSGEEQGRHKREPLKLTPPSGKSGRLRDLIRDAAPLPPARHAAPDSPAPLFHPLRMRQILIAVASLSTPSGSPDIDAMATLLARVQPVRRVPRALKATLRHGAQLLLDTADVMMPFAFDAENLTQRLRRLMPVERLEVLLLSRDPDVPGGWAVRPRPGQPWRPYAPPPSRRPVIAVSDFGIASQATGPDAVWQALAGTVRQAGCPFIAIVPYPDRRIPEELRRLAVVVPWDRATLVGAVMRGKAAGRTGC